jgi:outer membrane protein assembly factor BamB
VVHLLRREDGAFAARANTDGSAVRSEPVRLGAGLLLQTANGGLHALEAR